MPYKDPDQQRRYQQGWIARRRAAWFADKQCLRCGSTHDLELDHRDPNTKVTHRVWSWSTTRRDAELAKCQVLCKPCHVWKTEGCDEKAIGEGHGHSKLTERQVTNLRDEAARGETRETLAERYAISPRHVNRLVRRDQWDHLP